MCYITLVKPEAKRENQKQTLNKLHNFKAILDSYYAISLVNKTVI